MTTYRLLNNVNGFHEAFVDFRAMRKQFEGVKVWFSQKNESLGDRLKGDWQPVAVTFESDKKSNAVPDISVWNYSCLVLSEKAKNDLGPLLEGVGEFFPLVDGFWLFNCLDAVGGEVIDHAKSKFQMESEDSMHIPKELVLLEEKVQGKLLFKPGFAHNSFLLCADAFKDVVEDSQLGGVVFEKDLARVFL
ncbi:hypothetical protein L1F30_07170 [Simiduia sp. 21SJ11W-1]|uniref:imm11 family protein n=1 Tax=Simiduia sp. 21SJ11W-1 TaxID=2909669 RepID=UPI00209CCD12|nr:DUF1629 domain-containing protein [Simiduia sp. 21SJ11W-1]UTA49312.1 hypothetical protein L1F30_07170 [Simiduia sp. 21SJ11W-1]